MQKTTVSPEGERLAEVIRAVGMSSREFAKNIGYSNPQVLYNAIHGRNGISARLRTAIEKNFPIINMAYIDSGFGPIFKSDMLPAFKRVRKILGFYRMAPLDLAQKVGIGYTGYITDAMVNDINPPFALLTAISEAMPDIPREWLFKGVGKWPNEEANTPQGIRNCDFTYTMPDLSMHPEIQRGDKVGCRTIKPDEPIISGKCYHIKMKYGAMIRRVYIDGEGYRMESNNEQFSPMSVTRSEIVEVSSVVWLLRDYE